MLSTSGLSQINTLLEEDKLGELIGQASQMVSGKTNGSAISYPTGPTVVESNASPATYLAGPAVVESNISPATYFAKPALDSSQPSA